MNTASVKGFKIVGNTTFVEYEESKNGSAGSKAKLILEFIKSHGDQAYFSKEIVEALKESGIRATDVKSNVRRFERRGLIFVRGYRVNERQTSVSERLPVNMA
jgi:DNA-binding MarR family transcriptional regulator